MSHVIQWFTTVLVPALFGFLGILAGAWLTARRERDRARLEFITRQLREFYSPMLGLRYEILSLSQYRESVSQKGQEVWQETCERGREMQEPEAYNRLLAPERTKLLSTIEYNNRQLKEELIPAWSRMIEHFRDNFWLAEPETRGYYAMLISYVEGWNRHLSGTHSPEVMGRMQVSEKNLLPFYEHIEKVHNDLRQKVKEADTGK